MSLVAGGSGTGERKAELLASITNISMPTLILPYVGAHPLWMS